ncbi:MAG: TonB-dependent receptor [Proteobacteria bacterium]|nr:TonB-dependent receptor [Pseudomonadota bacterium]
MFVPKRKITPICALTGLIGLAGVAVLAASAPAQAEDAGYWDIDEATGIERLTVIGSKGRRLEIPGSATRIGPEELEKFEYTDINRILRQVPGVNIQEEDGFGLRPNIGIRGTGIERSERITLMEDGVLIAPAPYAAPAAYYFPTAGRLEAVEVRKGSSAIKFGPRTTGGAINLVSTSIPDQPGGKVMARIGSHGVKELHAWGSVSSGNLAIMGETFQAGADGFKRLPNGASTGFDIEDYLIKARLSAGETAARVQFLELKAGTVRQTSNETYLGLTEEDFAADPLQRYAASALDEFNSKHTQLQATHYVEFGPRVDITSVLYYNAFERDWFKLDDLDFGDGRGRIRPREVFENPTDPLNVAALAILRGEADSIDDALQLRHNAREYQSYGVQIVAGFGFDIGASQHDLEISLRYHEDEEDRLQNRENFAMRGGSLVLTSVGAPGSQANRVGSARALAMYVQDEIVIGDFRLIPGLRVESIDLTRRDYSTDDPERLAGPTRVRRNSLTVAIPGFGVTYDASDELTLIAGVHKGFSPPGPGTGGSSEAAVSEKSVNWEAGLRYVSGDLNLEAIGFYSDYSNLLGTCSNATGCGAGDNGDQFNGGAVDVIGLELTVDTIVDLSPGVTLPLKLTYTYTDAEFSTSFADSFWGEVEKGDALPYIPAHQVNASVGLEGLKWALNLTLNYVAETRNRAGSGAVPVLQRIDGRLVADVSASYNIRHNVRLFASIENLFDNVYVVARRPYGARPGKPRSVFGGLSVSF